MKYSANLISRVSAPSVTETDSGLSMQSATPAAALRAVAGSPSGLYQTRRGSFMILVVGTLALLAVITLLYVGIGRSDRSGAAAAVRSSNTEAVPNLAKDYMAQVIADSAVSMFEPTAFLNVPDDQREFLRKTWDYPSTDWRLQTYVTDPDDPAYFTPTGGRTGTTPFLATNDPTWMNYNNGNPPTPAPGPQPKDVLKNYNDWYHISNFAPDGSFVNLVNLRNNFDATPREMRQDLFTMNLAGVAQNTTDFGRAIIRVGGAPGNPADMSMRQANMFREVRLAPLNGANVDDIDWLSYSYSDNDGDGMFDGRLFELVDWRDTSSNAFKSILPQDQNYRWYFSATCRDLTGRVNVNTATDFFYPNGVVPPVPGALQPNAQLPVGVTPAEVDLQRLLSHTDIIEQYGISYGFLNQPLPLGSSPNEDYSLTGGAGGPGAALGGYVNASAPLFGKLSYDRIRRTVSDSLMTRTSFEPLATYVYDFATPVQRYTEYLLHAGRPGELSASGSGIPNYSSSGGFPIADQIELMAYGTSNDPAVESRLETVVGGRAMSARDQRLSPLRSNRSLKVERDFELARVADEMEKRRVQAIIDIRHNLTVVSGARDFRPGILTPLSGFVPPALGAGDVKLDAQGMLAMHDGVQLPLPMDLATNDDLNRLDERGRAEHDIFMGYANALLPELPAGLRANAWLPQNNPLAQAVRTRMYGYGSAWATGPAPSTRLAPQLPLFASAFMAVNMIDAVDTDRQQFRPYPNTNLIDLEENSPTPKTVLVANVFRTNLMADYQSSPNGDEPAVQPNPIEFDTSLPTTTGNRTHPWAHWVDPGKIGQFDLNQGKGANQRLFPGALTGGAGTVPLVPAINVYGIEAQPFITQVANLTVYTDTPQAFGGDDDIGIFDSLNNTYSDNISIKGDWPTDEAWDITVPGANPDVVCRVVAFQLSNPFDHEVVLSYGGASSMFQNVNALDTASYPEIDRERDFYYLEYCGHFYKMAWQIDQVDSAGNYVNMSTLRRLAIPAGKSIVVYALNRPANVIGQRWVELGLSAGGVAAKIDTWLAGQFDGENEGFYQVPRFVPTDVTGSTGQVLNAFNATPVSIDANVNRFAHLWRAQRAADFEGSTQMHEGARKLAVTVPDGWDNTPAPAPGTTLVWARNARENDRLVDRFVAPTSDDLARKLDDTEQRIQGAPAGPEGNLSFFNNGITVMMWGSARRRDFDTPGAPGDRPLGVMPPWCVEPKTEVQLANWNRSKVDLLPTANPSMGDILASGVGDATFDGWYTVSSGASVIDDIKLHPSTRSVRPIGPPIVPPVSDPTATYADVAGEVFLDNEQFLRTVATTPPTTVSTIRLADMLKPFCMGPFEAPVKNDGTFISQLGTNSGPNMLALDQRWVTLSQVLAVAYGYDSIAGIPALPGPAAGSNRVLELFKPFTVADPGPPAATIRHDVQVGGHIVIDDFVPFSDSAPGNRRFSVADANDYRTGLGVPLAMNILDNFTMASTLSGLTKAKPGMININTANRNVLSCLPMLSPPADNAIYGPTWWWPAGATPTARLDSKTDIVATYLAYRDKLPVEVRPPARVSPILDVRFFGDGVPPDAAVIDGRDATTSIKYIQESPGVRSVGELLAARMRVDPDGNAVPKDNTSNIDFRGYVADPGAGISLTHPGVASINYKDGGGVADKPSEALNSFNNTIDIANAAMTASTVRSDYFAVYFTVQGYQKADVENLKPTDPMVPSIKRRFLMIVDRSNVVKVGDKPRILAFKELPN